jgi:hypothetical protein
MIFLPCSPLAPTEPVCWLPFPSTGLAAATARPRHSDRFGLSGAALWRSFLFQSTESIAYWPAQSHLIRRSRRGDAAQNERRHVNPAAATTTLTMAAGQCVNPPLR